MLSLANPRNTTKLHRVLDSSRRILEVAAEKETGKGKESCWQQQQLFSSRPTIQVLGERPELRDVYSHVKVVHQRVHSLYC